MREMNQRGSLLDELRIQYEAHEPADDRGDVETFEAIDARAPALLHVHQGDPPRWPIGRAAVSESVR
jgi:hypothetical protein